MSAVCGCDHSHLPGCTHCYACGLPVPQDVPPVLTPTPPGSAGGTQTQEGSDAEPVH